MVEIDNYVSARRYLAPFTSSLWFWDDQGQVIAWSDNVTVAFRAEVQRLLERLAPHGLPPMNAIVFLLAACRDNWETVSSQLLANVGWMASVERSDLPEWLSELFVQLDAVHELPAELRSSPEAKAELAGIAFEGHFGGLPPSEAAKIVSVLSSHTEPGMLAAQFRARRGFEDFLRELRILHDGLAKFDPESLQLRRRTGLDRLVEAADLEIEPGESARQLIARLQDDEELGGMARLARQLMAAVHLPRGISDWEDLPVGGVSDISNRGALDRLLLSELAHDDMTLAVRVAVNEALYLRRETPPRNPPKHRAVLIDSGLRLWGIPRVFAAAVAAALTAAGGPRIRVASFRARGREVAPVDLTTREGLVAHLEALEPDAHPGDALAAFVQAACADDDLADAVIVTGEDVVSDREFQQALAAVDLPSIYLATVGRDGRFRLWSRSLRGSKFLREARLDLDRILAAPRRAVTSLIDPNWPSDLPAILSVKPFPLLLSHQPIDPRRAWLVPEKGALSISRDLGLMHWPRGDRGASILMENAPAGLVHWTDSDESLAVAVVGNLQQRSLWFLSADLDSGICDVYPLEVDVLSEEDRLLGVSGHGGKVFLIFADRVDVLDGGRKIQSVQLRLSEEPRASTSFKPGSTCIWRHGRFFINQGRWCVLAIDGTDANFEPIVVELDLQSPPAFIDFVECAGVEGPIGITLFGTLYDPTHDKEIPVAHALAGSPKVKAIARQGNRIVLCQSDDETKMSVVDLPLGTSRRITGNPIEAVESDLFRAARPRGVRTHFTSIFVDESNCLTLVNRRGRQVAIFQDVRGRPIFLRERKAPAQIKRLLQVFQAAPSPPDVGYTLQLAAWADGSRAWLDSRGLLHLKSSDRAIPELTLVLHDGVVSGWVADGRVFGIVYFTGDVETTSPDVIFRDILQPFAARLG